jgi:hypothetical protein
VVPKEKAMLDRVQIKATASGTAGNASATAYSPHVSGQILKVHVDYQDDTNTTDIALVDDADPAAEEIVDLDNQDTDKTLYPRRAVQDNAGNNVTYDGTNEIYEPYVVHGRLKLTVAQADDEDVVEVTVWLRR